MVLHTKGPLFLADIFTGKENFKTENISAMSLPICLCQVIALSILFIPEVCLAGKKIPASFVFGDSLVDAGNNNYLTTLSKANYDPNGIDFGSATGRFTNGRTIVDIVSK